ncbi:mitochondrial chaperone BCS1 [Xylariales sp. AK1849]|nr:mitochondrial chaperone BCS1 [Xylariales sp. AK1849]
MCLEAFARKNKSFVRIYTFNAYYWRLKSNTPARPLPTIHLDQEVERSLLDDMKRYLSPETRTRYQLRGMPYQRGYLFYGPPGTGKSTLSAVLAGLFSLDLYIISMPSVLDDDHLNKMFKAIPDRGILLLEDIDAAGVGRKTRKSTTMGCTLSGLLNALDGVDTQQGRVIIMTTNKPETLDEALTRPGRIDKKIYVGHINQACAAEMFLRMFEPEVTRRLGAEDNQPETAAKINGMEKAASTVTEQSSATLQYACSCATCLVLDTSELRKIASEFSKQIPEHTITPAQLQGFFQIHMDCPKQAQDDVLEWVEQQKRGNNYNQNNAVANVAADGLNVDGKNCTEVEGAMETDADAKKADNGEAEDKRSQ